MKSLSNKQREEVLFRLVRASRPPLRMMRMAGKVCRSGHQPRRCFFLSLAGWLLAVLLGYASLAGLPLQMSKANGWHVVGAQ